ncbi:MAG: hypothetical protein OEN02_16320, partial [Gammaproteobacteria bacterium]|nr:hypothetical protein [Gammaproteobacteria bacterium]
VVIAVHAPYSLVDYDAPNRNNAPRRIGHLYKNLMGTYPGSLGNYAGTYLGVPVITLELPHSGIMPSSRQISALWTDLVRWLIRNINSAVMPVRATPTNLVPETPQSISRATPPGDLSLARN